MELLEQKSQELQICILIPELCQGSGPMFSVVDSQSPQYGSPISKAEPPFQSLGGPLFYGPGLISEAPGHMANLAPWKPLQNWAQGAKWSWRTSIAPTDHRLWCMGHGL
ncbi:hypothetical protein O181_000627 [Austropuccinia psidii MF-1]|uniref:Uncharacterized protein n=1 Tax=Austropuccinia psidii MF-1 TaxID=1389203 RepID=A0A9Q3B907_9BASI|nr:hypothetical protein [Austropuccinia psidii MF-1]